MTETEKPKTSMTFRQLADKYHVRYVTIYQSAVTSKYPTHKDSLGRLCCYEEDYIEFLAHKYDRTRSKFNGEPLYGKGEISVQECSKLFGISLDTLYKKVRFGELPHYRKGKAIILNYEECMKHYIKKEEGQMEMFS